MLVQQSTVMLWSSITGTRPGVLLLKLSSPAAQSTSGAKSVDGTLSQGQDLPTTSTTRGRKQNEAFKSDLLKYRFIHDTPKTVLWEDIELFYLRNPDGGVETCFVLSSILGI